MWPNAWPLRENQKNGIVRACHEVAHVADSCAILGKEKAGLADLSFPKNPRDRKKKKKTVAFGDHTVSYWAFTFWFRMVCGRQCSWPGSTNPISRRTHSVSFALRLWMLTAGHGLRIELCTCRLEYTGSISGSVVSHFCGVYACLWFLQKFRSFDGLTGRMSVLALKRHRKACPHKHFTMK